MASARKKLRMIDGLRLMFPGKWVFCGNSWKGEQFSIYRTHEGFFRSDTQEKVLIPTVDLRTCRRSRVVDFLGRKYGGLWEKVEWATRWKSKEHDFFVYRGSELRGEKLVAVYRRSDTMEIIPYRNNKIPASSHRTKHNTHLAPTP